MNSLERALIEKAGREHGWEVVIESVGTHVILASARHRGRVTVSAGADATSAWCVAFPDGRLIQELGRSVPGSRLTNDLFRAAGIGALAVLFRRAAELASSLPDQAVRTFRERSAATLAATALRSTEIERLVRQRVGQDVFREALLDYWAGGCAVTGVAVLEVLRASHAKPWAECSSDDERLDVFNGFILVAHLDALFDRGLITFDANGMLIISSRLGATERAQLHLDENMRLRWLAGDHIPYLQWHREHLFH